MSIQSTINKASAQLKTAGETITAGTLLELISDVAYVNKPIYTVGSTLTTGNNNNGGNFKGCLISANKFVVAYVNSSNYVAVVAVSVASNNVVTVGTPLAIGTDVSILDNGICAVDTDKFLIAYSMPSNGTKIGTCSVCTVSTLTITAGSPVVFNNGTSTDISCCKLNTDKAVIMYKHADNAPHARACTISGTVPTFGTDIAAFGGNLTAGDLTACDQLDIDKFIAVAPNTPGTATYSRVFTVSGTTITGGSSYTLGVTSNYPLVVAMSTTSAIIIYELTATTKAYMRGLTLSGTTVTYGTAVLIDDINTSYHSIVKLSATSAYYSYNDSADSTQAKYVIISFDPVTRAVTNSTPTVYVSGAGGQFARNAVIYNGTDKLLFPNTDPTTGYLDGDIITLNAATGYAATASNSFNKVAFIPF